ncbi:MAG TPA: hypothetical protein VHX42_04520 [Candidatus Babeliales bacterium]|jgi:hypothetical protein|nr:hypothetical protein [Candidatus Babeliales bacterium]
MKALQIIVSFIAINNFSLHSMISIPKNSCLNTFKKKIYNPVFKKKALQFCKINDIENIATAGNIVATCATADPLFLLQTIPQLVHRTASYLQEQKTPPMQFDQDLKYFLQQPAVIDYLKTIKEIDQKINSFASFHNTKISEHFNSEIFQLKKKKKEVSLKLIKEVEPLFQSYKNIHIPTCIKKEALNLTLSKKIDSWKDKGFCLSCVSFMPGIVSSICIPISIYTVPVAFSTALALWRMACMVENENQKRQEKMFKEQENTIKMLTIYQDYKESQKNQSTTTNE